VTELKDKAAKIDLEIPKTLKTGKKGAAPVAETATGVDNDAVSALVNLGYARNEAYSAVLQARNKANDNSSLQDLIRLALKELAK
jgi:Holliday junction DNA helicase RuvA